MLSESEWRKANAIYQQAHREHAAKQGRQPRVEWGDNRHHDVHFLTGRDLLLHDAGILTRAQCHPDTDFYSPWNFARFFRERISMGGSIPPSLEQPGEIFQRALVMGDLQSFTQNVQTEAATRGFNDGDEPYELLINVSEVPNFKSVPVPRSPDLPQLNEVPEAGEVPHVAIIDDGAELASVTAHSAQFTISRQAIISSDLQRIALTPYAAGARARRTERAKCFSILSTNAAMSDGENLFSSAHNNDSSTPAAPSTSAVDELRALMAGHTSPAGDSLNCRVDFLLGPPEYESAFSAVRQAANAPDPRGVSTSFVSTLTDASLTGGTNWYGFSDPARFAAITLFVLTGARLPNIERLTQPPSTAPDGLHFRLIHDFAMIPVDYRGVARNAGA